VLESNGRYVIVGAPKGKWIKPMDRVIPAMTYSKVVHQEMGMMMTRASKDYPSLLVELMQQGKVTPCRRLLRDDKPSTWFVSVGGNR